MDIPAAGSSSTETFSTYNNRARLFPSPKGWGNVGELERGVSKHSPHPSSTGIKPLMPTKEEGTSYALCLPHVRARTPGRRHP